MRKLCFLLIILTAFVTGCSSGSDQAGSQPAPATNANANASAPVAQNGSPLVPSAQPSVVAPAPSTPPVAKTESKPAAKADGSPAANTNPTPPRASGKTPRLVLPLANIDFGSVYQGKSLTRNLLVKNLGKADLNIESVVPS